MGVPQRERYSATPFAVSVRRFITATGRRATSSPRGSVPRVRRRGNQSGKKLNITPDREAVREARDLAASIVKFWSFWPSNAVDSAVISSP